MGIEKDSLPKGTAATLNERARDIKSHSNSQKIDKQVHTHSSQSPVKPFVQCLYESKTFEKSEMRTRTQWRTTLASVAVNRVL